MKVFEALANALAEESVTEIFGLMGDGNLKFLSYWASELGQGYHGTRHESAAIAMADGYSRVSGRTGVCTVTQGPGLTNALTALITARKAGSRLLLLAGDVAQAQRGWPQDVDHAAIFAAAGVPVVNIGDPKTPYADIVAAYRRAGSGAGPVAVNMPIDIQDADWDAWADEPAATAGASPVQAAAADVQRAAALLSRARKPAIIAGRGAVEAGCQSTLADIGGRIGALLATTLRGKGTFDGDPFLIGIAGGLGTNLSAKLIGEADAVLVVGAGMNDFTTLRQTLLAESADVVCCDLRDRDLKRPGGELVMLTGDAAVTVPQLLAELAGPDGGLAELAGPDGGLAGQAGQAELAGEAKLAGQPGGGHGYRTPAMAAELAAFRPESELVLADGQPYLDPRSLTIALDRLLPRDRVVVTDAGHFFGNPCTYMRVPDARSFICGIDFGSIGLGIGHAMGAAVASPGRPVVLFVGDGGLQMSLGDLETAVRYRLPILVVVMNDAAYGSELQIMRLWQLPEELSVFPPTDFAAIASAVGARSLRIRSLDDLGQVTGLSLDSGPVLLDCAISRDVRAAWLDEAFTR